MSGPARVLTIPYATLVHDNHRFIAVRIGRAARLALAPGYRAGKNAIHDLGVASCAGLLPSAEPLVLVGVLYPPDRRRRDQRNYAKAITDALSGVWYDDDSQLVAELWLKGAVSKDNPRMELSLYAASAAPAPFRLAYDVVALAADRSRAA